MSKNLSLRMKPGPKPNPAIQDRDRLLFSLWQQLNTTHTLAQIGQMVDGCRSLSVARLSKIIIREREKAAARDAERRGV